MTLRRYTYVWVASILCVAVFAGTSTAQNRGSTNQRGGLGQTASGQSAFGQSGMGRSGQSSFGTGGNGQGRGGTSFGSNSFGGGSFGGAGGTGFGAAAGGQGFGNNQAGVVGQGNFLGGNAAQTQNFFRNLNGGQQRTAMFDFMIENLNEMRDRGNRGNSNDRSPPVRVKLRPAFETPLGTMQQITNDLQTRLTTNITDLGVADSRVSLDGRNLKLEGKVGSEHQRELIEKMISLEPGVSTIENRLVIDPTIKDKK